MKKKFKWPKWLLYPEDWKIRLDEVSAEDFDYLLKHMTDLTDEQWNDPAFEAVLDADFYTGYAWPIINFLLNNKPSPWGREVIADWGQRNKGDPARKIPIYVKCTLVELTHTMAIYHLNHTRRTKGVSQDDAIKFYANHFGIPENSLKGAYKRSRKKRSKSPHDIER